LATKCIYCPNTSERPFSKAEHVLPQAFGKFDSREGNLTLHSVCPDCNSFFGRKLEQYFGRDTGDAFLRLLTGLKSADEASEIGGRRLTFRIDEPGSEHHGAWMTLAHSDEHGVVTQLLPQVGFRGTLETQWNWFRIWDLEPERSGEFRKRRFTILGTPEETATIVARLREIGVEIKEAIWNGDPDASQPPNATPVTLEIRYALDDVVLRTVAKIAFNYLTHVTQDRVPDFVYRPEFDALREFIRKGVQPSWDPVVVSSKKMLLGDTGQHRITGGHLLGVSWPHPRQVPIGKVSLFNEITYVVRFSGDVPGIWWDLDSGHIFDINRRVVAKMSSANPLILGRN
jgi:hypothetical protein